MVIAEAGHLCSQLVHPLQSSALYVGGAAHPKHLWASLRASVFYSRSKPHQRKGLLSPGQDGEEGPFGLARIVRIQLFNTYGLRSEAVSF